MPPLTLNQFNQTVRNDLVSRARFEVVINTNAVNLGGGGSGLGNILAGIPTFTSTVTAWANNLFLCDEAEIPGVNLLTKEARTYGPEYKVPYQRSYDPVQLSFLVLKDFQVRSFFESWVHSISHYNNNTIGYYGSYVTDIHIFVYSIEAHGFINKLFGSAISGGVFPIPNIPSRIGNVLGNILGGNQQLQQFGIPGLPNPFNEPAILHHCVLQNAYPVRIDTTPLSWNDTDSIMKQTVNFNYESIYFPALAKPISSIYNNRLHIDQQLEGAKG